MSAFWIAVIAFVVLFCLRASLTGLSKTHYLEAKVLNILRATNITAPANVYLVLYTALPTDAGNDGTEVSDSGTGYVRQAITFSAPSNQSPSSAKISNSADITFPVATANYGTVVGVGIIDSATYGAGNLLYWGALDSNQVINSTNQFLMPAGNLTVEED